MKKIKENKPHEIYDLGSIPEHHWEYLYLDDEKYPLKDIKNYFKGVKVLKDKKVNISILLKVNSLEDFNKLYIGEDDRLLTQEEFDLLKEIFL